MEEVIAETTTYDLIFPEAAPVPKRVNRGKSCVNRRKRQQLLEIDPHCKYCRCPLTLENSTLDHVIPLSKGGGNHIQNLVLACSDCNQKKADN
jgi:5-methylcytosine-specific restriction endonuclease McrA